MYSNIFFITANLHERFVRVASEYYANKNSQQNMRTAKDILEKPTAVDHFVCLSLKPEEHDAAIEVSVKPLETIKNISKQSFFTINDTEETSPQLLQKMFPCCCGIPFLRESVVCPCSDICKHGVKNLVLTHVDSLPIEQSCNNAVEEDEIDADFDDPEISVPTVSKAGEKKSKSSCSACKAAGLSGEDHASRRSRNCPLRKKDVDGRYYYGIMYINVIPYVTYFHWQVVSRCGERKR